MLMPNALFASSVPASDWNIRSIGQPSVERLHLDRDVREHAVLGRDSIAAGAARRARAGSRPSTPAVSVAGLTPITASPQPYGSPSRVDARMPCTSSVGWFGWQRDDSRPGSPNVEFARHDLALGAHRHQIEVRHQLARRRRHLRRQARADRAQRRPRRADVEQPLAELAHRQVRDRAERLLVELVLDARVSSSRS